MPHTRECKCLDCFITQTEREWREIMKAVTGLEHQ